jgi:type II secretory pathway pseudopilin PulG
MATALSTGTVTGMSKRAFTLLETVATFAVVGILLSAGFVAFNRTEQKTTDTRYALELRQLAASLGSFEESRGYFPMDSTTLASLEPGTTFVVNGVSTKKSEYSLATGSDITDASIVVLGIAVLNEDNSRCVTLTQPPIDNNVVQYRSGVFTPTAALPCSGASALLQVGKAW